MASLEKKIEVEVKTKEFLREHGLPEPDAVEYGYGCIRLIYEQEKVCLVVDIDKPEDGYGPEPA